MPATSAGLPRKASFFDAAINSTNETNKAGGTRHLSVYITFCIQLLFDSFHHLKSLLYKNEREIKIFFKQDDCPFIIFMRQEEYFGYR